ncbi:MAG: hypothetical protein WCT85_04345 [Parachlamydiales bacterium]|jgi:tetratricopeptide (TPR) repeat protein
MLRFFSKNCLYFLLFISSAFSLNSNENPLLNTSNEEETLFLRRIADFWQDGELEIAKFQIESHFKENPKSPLNDSLFAILGNIYLNEKNYSKAVSCYENIKSVDIKDKIATNLLEGLYNLKWHTRLIEECNNYIDKVDDSLKQKIIFLQALSYYDKATEINDETEKNQNFNLSKSKFELLLDSKFQNESREYLSQIHKKLNDYQAACKYYLDLAEKDPQKKESYLFQAALLESTFDKEKAIKTFDEIISLNPNNAADAAYNKLILLFDMKKYDSIILDKNKFLSIVKSEKHPLINLFIGKSFFYSNDFQNAIDHLQKSLAVEDKTSNEFKIALLMLIQSAFNLNNIEVFNNAFEEYASKFPNDENLFENYFAKAVIIKKNEKLSEAKELFEKISKDFKESENNEKFLFEHAHLLFLMNDVENSKIKFKELLQKFPNQELAKPSHSYLINLIILQIQKEESSENKNFLRNSLICEIQSVLEKESLFSQKEISEYQFLLSKTYYDLENYEQALSLLKNILKINEQNPELFSKNRLSEINLLTAFCHKNINENLNEFIHFAKIALDLSEDKTNHFVTYLNLFNSYLSLSKKGDLVDENNLLNAALYLYKAYEHSPKQVIKENLLWLSDYYSNLVHKYMSENYKNSLVASLENTTYCQRAITILKDLILENDENFESSSVKLSYLYKFQDNINEAKKIITSLIETYRQNPEKPYKHFEECVYLLATIYDNENLKDQALCLYQEFFNNFKQENPFKSKASLHYDRLQLSNISKENFSPDNKELEKIISSLKTISLQKNLENEPTHLEAALDYVDVICSMEGANNWKKRLFLLGRTKENFISQDNLVSQDYQTLKSSSKDKEKIFNSYINLIDIEKYISLGYLEKNDSHIKKAAALLEEMNTKDFICTKFLENRVNKNLKLIEDFNFEKK